MTREEMIALANQAGMSNLSLIDIGYLEVFVNLILEAAEIEAAYEAGYSAGYDACLEEQEE